MQIDKDPQVMPTQMAYDYVKAVELHESEGWKYRVIVEPTSGLAIIMVYDKEGHVCGPL